LKEKSLNSSEEPMVLLLFILQYLFVKLVEGEQKVFNVQVFPAGYTWVVSVISDNSHLVQVL